MNNLMKSAQKPGTIFVICGPSGAGKTTIMTQALEQLAPVIKINRVITYTTRAPRIGEINGLDYHFITLEQFKKLEAEGFFFETVNFNHNFYASPISFVHDAEQGISSLALLTLSVANEVAARVNTPTVFIGIVPPSLEVLKRRLELRKTDSPAVIENRLALGKQEIEELAQNKLFKNSIVNDQFETAIEQLVAIIKTNLLLAKS